MLTKTKIVIFTVIRFKYLLNYLKRQLYTKKTNKEKKKN